MSHDLYQQIAALRHNMELAQIQGRQAVSLELHAAEWVANELQRLKGLAELKKKLTERVEWLRREWQNGGNYEHLFAREQECAYIAELVTKLLSSADGAIKS